MKMRRFVWMGVLAIVLFSCGAPKSLTTSKTDAQTFEAAGNYSQAVTAWKQYFDQTDIEQVSGDEFANAAKTAFKTGDNGLSKSWFDQARYKNYADADMYETLAQIYKAEDNLSKELSALEFFVENYGTKDPEVNTRLLAIYKEIDSNEQALQVWSNMAEQTQAMEANLNNYFAVNQNLENKEVCDSLASVLLEKNPEHVLALEWNAKKYYWAGQKRYEREMAKYNAKKTRKNYNTLLKELDLVTADFKKALPYLDKLWKLNPGKEYAGYLANIYARFGDEKKTNYYKNYMK